MSQPVEPAKGPIASPTASPGPDSTSAKVKDEIKSTIIPQLQAQGRDPSSKDVYPTVINDLAKRYGVSYNAVKKQWDKVLSEGGTKPQQPQPQTTTRTVGGVTMEVKAEPKPPRAEKQSTCPKCGAPLTPDHQCTQAATQEIIEIDGKKYNKVKLANGQIALQEVQEKQEKPPPTPEELERSKKFSVRLLKWVRAKGELDSDEETDNLIGDEIKDIMLEWKAKFPTALRAVIVGFMILAFYIVPAASNVRKKMQAAKDKLAGKPEEKPQ